MDLQTFTSFFGWMTVINFVLLLFSTLILSFFKNPVLRCHQQLTGLESATLRPVYFYFLAGYKLLILIFNLTPYLALKLL